MKPRPRTPPWRRKLSFTRAGRWYTAITVGLGFAAINTGNNLLFLVLGLMLSSIVVSGILSEQSLKRVQVERRLPLGASVGEPALVGLFARNQKKRAPSFALELREGEGDVRGSGFLVMLGAGQAQEASYRFVPTRRGRHLFRTLEIATRAPFGLFEKARPLDADAELVVFPRRVPAPPLAPSSTAREGEQPAGREGLGLEMHALRDHRPAEDARSIHWRSSARAGRLIGIDREDERRRRICVALDHRGLAGERLEGAVEQAAALIERELHAGAEVALAVPGTTLSAGSGEAHLRAALTVLALLEPAQSGPAPAVDPHMAVLEVRP